MKNNNGNKSTQQASVQVNPHAAAIAEDAALQAALEAEEEVRESSHKTAAVIVEEDMVDDQVPLAEVGSKKPRREKKAIPTERRMVKVRPRKTIPKMRVGSKWYSFTQGKEVIVPIGVKRHLQERDII